MSTSRPARKTNRKPASIRRRYPVGAEVTRRGTHFRVWAPEAEKLEVILESPEGEPLIRALRAEGGGYYSGLIEAASAGMRYRLRLNGDPRKTYSDPASRFQPDGPFGSSEIINPEFSWTDTGWEGVRLQGQVLYEMHVGTFTREGNWQAATKQLSELASIGITLIEVMPVADFPGRFGWGYDGVNLYAPTWLYGRPGDFRSFVNTAHACKIGVILDVVYNHLGPDGNYLMEFARDYFSRRYSTDWGDALNFDGDNCGPVREYILTNVAYWMQEFHLDGLRLDATQNIYDATTPHILEEITRTARKSAKGREIVIVAENEPQDTKLLRSPGSGGYGMDAMWNDDFHHSAAVALSGHNEAYYSDHRGRPQEFISAMKRGFLYQGQWYSWQKQPRGTQSLHFSPCRFILFIQNHDQIANSARGFRVLQTTSPGRYRAMTTLLLLAPGTPMLFQGQEFAASTPFRYFSDHKPEISKNVLKGRAEFLAQFPSLRDPATQALLPDPGDPSTFEACKLDFSERERHAEAYALHKDLLDLRRTDPVFRMQRMGAVDGAVLGDGAFVLRYFGEEEDRLLVVNLLSDLHLSVCPEPLLAPPAGARWKILLSTEDPKYGGYGVYKPDDEGTWNIPGEAAVVLCPEARPVEPSDTSQKDKAAAKAEEGED